MASAFLCPDCGAPLASRSLVQFACDACARGFWLLGAQLMREDGTAVRSVRPRRPTPQKPVRAAPAGPRPVQRRDPASVRGARSGLDCVDCRVELLQAELGVLHCPGCGAGYWMRGAEVIRAGEQEALALPERVLPKATMRVRVRDSRAAKGETHSGDDGDGGGDDDDDDDGGDDDDDRES